MCNKLQRESFISPDTCSRNCLQCLNTIYINIIVVGTCLVEYFTGTTLLWKFAQAHYSTKGKARNQIGIDSIVCWHFYLAKHVCTIVRCLLGIRNNGGDCLNSPLFGQLVRSRSRDNVTYNDVHINSWSIPPAHSKGIPRMPCRF